MLKPHADVPRLRKLANSACGIRFVGFVPIGDGGDKWKQTFAANSNNENRPFDMKRCDPDLKDGNAAKQTVINRCQYDFGPLAKRLRSSSTSRVTVLKQCLPKVSGI
jgi:hypothetical protein